MQGCDSTGDVDARYPRILGDHLTPGLLNPIPTKGTDYAHHITTWHPRLANPSTSPVLYIYLYSKPKETQNHSHITSTVSLNRVA